MIEVRDVRKPSRPHSCCVMAGGGTLKDMLRDTGASTLDDAFVHLAHPERDP